MVDRVFNWRRAAITKSENRLRERILRRSPEQLAQEAKERAEEERITAQLRAARTEAQR